VREKHSFELETVDIYSRGQERWREAYKEWIPVLHINDELALKGRWATPEIMAAFDDVTRT